MLKGHPDYFGLPYFPRYGQLQSTGRLGVVLPGTTRTTIFEILVRGKVYGGYLMILLADNVLNDKVIITVDGTEVVGLVVGNLSDWGFNSPYMYPVYMTTLNLVDSYALTAYSPELPFEYQYKVEIDHPYGVASSVITEMIYYEITG